ncbi:unnamed protein product [Darwinula stevensoni]|uniref:Uncharacterized protein n=1 Tax=Darwinula stevensoni TaxID=69355 RepID=A0A7R9A4A7_9CRUS|nr:unnamed protein product [Darwinula stevensoni]CAG0893246.1 unnamed protein product [Darwinula stevensoni]
MQSIITRAGKQGPPLIMQSPHRGASQGNQLLRIRPARRGDPPHWDARRTEGPLLVRGYKRGEESTLGIQQGSLNRLISAVALSCKALTPVMKAFLVLCALVGISLGDVGYPYVPYVPYLQNVYHTQPAYHYLRSPNFAYKVDSYAFDHGYYRHAPVTYNPYVYHGAYVQAAPAYASSQYRSEGPFGEGAFGYTTHDQTHNAVRDAYGRVSGSYSYLSPEGKPLVFDYKADEHGFRVSSNALPKAPEVPDAPALEQPKQVDYTDEVKAAREAHFKAVEEAKAKTGHRRKRSVGYVSYAAPYVTPYAYPAVPRAYYAFPYTFPHYSPLVVRSYVAKKEEEEPAKVEKDDDKDKSNDDDNSKPEESKEENDGYPANTYPLRTYKVTTIKHKPLLYRAYTPHVVTYGYH